MTMDEDVLATVYKGKTYAFMIRPLGNPPRDADYEYAREVVVSAVNAALHDR